MSVTCKRGKQGSRGTGEDDVGRSLRKTWARCLISLFIGRPLPSCRAGLPWAEAEGRSGGASSEPNSSPSALPTCRFLTSHPQSCAPLLPTRFAPEQRAPCVHSCLGTGDGRCCPRDINSHSWWWDLVGGRVGAETTCFYSPGSPRLGGHVAWPGRCVEAAGVEECC